jgi:two-component system, LuxR family, sensor kinase FixL
VEGDNLSLLAVSEARLIGLLDTAVDGIIVIDEGGKVLVFNTACERMFGYQAREVVGRNLSCLMPGHHAQEHDGYLRAYCETGIRKIIGIGREVEGQRKDGSRFPLELSVGEALTPEGRQFIGILRDITLRRETEERLAALQADFIRLARMSDIDEMGVTVAHEINQPLTAILIYLQSAQRLREKTQGSEPESDPVGDLLERALGQTRRISDIITRIRKQVERRLPERMPGSLVAIVAEALTLALPGKGRHVLVDNTLAHDLPMVEMDAVQIQQIVVNLLRNACEALEGQENGLIRISANQEGSMLCLRISDNGPGIAPVMQETLFAAFHTSKKHGMGLGLSISRLIAQRHGGELLYETVSVPARLEGARFCLKLPVVNREMSQEEPSTKERSLAKASSSYSTDSA